MQCSQYNLEIGAIGKLSKSAQKELNRRKFRYLKKNLEVTGLCVVGGFEE